MNLPKMSVNFSEESSITPAIKFSYDILETTTRQVVLERTIEIKSLLRRTAQDIIDIGKKLSEVKQELGHGQFLDWLRTEFDWSESAARKFMQVHRKFKTVNFTNLNIATSAMYLLAADSTSETARNEALQRANDGEVITRAKAKASVQLHEPPIDNSTIDIDIENTSVSSVDLPCEPQPSPPLSHDKYQELSDGLNLLTESQIAALWQALSDRLNPTLLERLVVQTQQKLSSQ